MLHVTRSFVLRIGAGLIALWLAAAQSGALAYDGRPRFDQPALDAMIAPIALYPDQLLTQVMMAASYPQEVEEAARWSRERPGLSGDAAVRTAAGYDWDPSVRSLTAFPDVLDTMARHMAWTEDLGNAFIVQPQEVMDTVQRLRFRAHEAGTLASTEYTRVVNTGSALVIESVQPQVVYVPYYDPRVAYGSWWWPARPPMYWPRWRSYYEPHGRPGIVYWGPGTQLASGFFFGGFDWQRREVRVINTRPYYYAQRFEHQRAYVQSPHVWQHDNARRDAWRNRTQERTPQAQQRAPLRAPAFAPQQPAEAPRVQAPQVRSAPAAGGEEAPRMSVEERRRRAVSRNRDADGEIDTRPVARMPVNPVPQQPAAQRAPVPVPQPPAAAPPMQATPPAQMRSAPAAGGEEAPRMSVEERRRRAVSRERD